MLLIHNNQSQLGKRSKQGRAGADNHIHLSPSGALTLIVFFSGGKGGIHHRHPVTKPAVKPGQGLVGQSDFGNQHDGLSAPFKDLLNQSHINLGFPTPGNAVDEIGVGMSGIKICQYFIHNLLL